MQLRRPTELINTPSLSLSIYNRQSFASDGLEVLEQMRRLCSYFIMSSLAHLAAWNTLDLSGYRPAVWKEDFWDK